MHEGATHELKPSPFCFRSASALFPALLPDPDPSQTHSITVYSDCHSFTQNAHLWQDHLCSTQCWHRCSLDGSLPISTWKFHFFHTHSTIPFTCSSTQLPFQCFHFRSEPCSHHQIVFCSLPVHFRKFL